MNECWHCKFVMSGSVEIICEPSVWIRGPDLMIIPLCLRLSLCYLFLFLRQLVKKKQATKIGELRPFYFFFTFIFVILLGVLYT